MRVTFFPFAFKKEAMPIPHFFVHFFFLTLQILIIFLNFQSNSLPDTSIPPPNLLVEVSRPHSSPSSNPDLSINRLSQIAPPPSTLASFFSVPPPQIIKQQPELQQQPVPVASTTTTTSTVIPSLLRFIKNFFWKYFLLVKAFVAPSLPFFCILEKIYHERVRTFPLFLKIFPLN